MSDYPLLYVKRGKKIDTYYTILKDQYHGLGNDRDAAITKLRSLTGPQLDVDKWATELAIRCRRRAKAKGLPCEIDGAAIARLIVAQRMKCAISGERFREDVQPGKRIRMYVPSVDRKDSALGYTAANARVVCAFVNLAMNQFGEDAIRFRRR